MRDNPIVLTDRAGVIRFWNAGAEAAFGHPAAEALGETLNLIVPAEFREAHWRGFRRAVESGAADVEDQVTSFPVRHAAGQVLEVSGRLALVREPQGNVVAVLVAFE